MTGDERVATRGNGTRQDPPVRFSLPNAMSGLSKILQ
jgi:hypothetical protein